MSRELDGLFNRLKQGVELTTPSEQNFFAAAVKTRRTHAPLKEAFASFNSSRHQIQITMLTFNKLPALIQDRLSRTALNHKVTKGAFR